MKLTNEKNIISGIKKIHNKNSNIKIVSTNSKHNVIYSNNKK